MTEKAKVKDAPPPPLPPAAEPEVVEAPPAVIQDGSSEAGVQPPSFVGTHLCQSRNTAPEDEGE